MLHNLNWGCLYKKRFSMSVQAASTPGFSMTSTASNRQEMSSRASNSR
jgi:hypothetical protein